MTSSQLQIYDELKWRGLIHQATDEQHLAQWLSEGSRTLYVGVDPTADSLHIGHFLPLMTLRRFQRAGHRPIALVGGATGMIGDPSGKSEERNLLSVDALRANVAGMERQMRRLLDFDTPSRRGPVGQQLRLDVPVRLPGVSAGCRQELSRERHAGQGLGQEPLERSDAGLSYTEFSYMLLQAYDFVHLYEQYGCELQVGGSDQWGNITAGIDLRGACTACSSTASRCRCSRSPTARRWARPSRGPSGCRPERTSPYAFYQYWINVADDDAGKCLRLLTELDRAEIEALDASRRDEPHLRHSQRRLAQTLTQLVHGDAGLAKAQQATQVFFGAEIGDLSDRELLEIFADVPSQQVPRARLEGDGLSLIEALVLSGLAKSNGEARRAIEQGGAYVNNRRRTDLADRLTGADLAGESVAVLRSGKKRYALLRFAN